MKKLILILLIAICGTANAQYTKLLDFNGTKGSQPYGSLISDGTFLYGMTNQGGKAGYGVLFKIMPDGTAYDTLMNFLGVSNGAFPRGSLITDGTFLYGMTSQGGTGSRGTIFKIKPDGTGYVKLLDFLGTANGGNPEGDLMFDGTFLYGMTGQGGTHSNGTIFKIKPNGTSYTNLYNFGDLGAYDASGPNGSLVYDGTFLYGVTPGGGINNTGTIFKIKPDGTGYVKIFDFSTISSGIYPEASLISDGNFLYGVAHYGGASSGSGGVVFKIKPDGSEYAVLHDFSGIDGCTPTGSLISDGTFLHGMTANGGTSSCGNGNGTIFKIRPDGTSFSKLLDFTGVANGKYPLAALYSDGGYLYGMTQLGGANNNGTIFKFYNFTIDNVNSTSVSCYGGNNGTASVITNGGLAPYTYIWNTSPIQTTQTATGLTAGNYTVTVTDANSFSATASVNVTQLPATIINAGADTTITCGSSAHLNAQSNWVTLNSGINGPLYSVYFVNTDTGYAVGGGGGIAGTIYKTTNSGGSWTAQSNGALHDLYSVYFNDVNNGYAVGDGETILKTVNGGTTWTTISSRVSANYRSVYFTDANTGYVVGEFGKILKTINGGSNWVTQSSGTTNDLYSIYFTDADTGYVVGNAGTILKTTNGGGNWTVLSSGTYFVQSVYFTDANTGYAVGGLKLIIKTIDGGSNWTVLSSGAGWGYQSVFFTSPDTGYVVGAAGSSGIIFKTTDGGNNWTQQSIGTSPYLYSVHFPKNNTGFVVGSVGKILKLSIPDSYSWSPSNGLSASNIANPIASPTVTTKYFVTATSDNGCAAVDSVTVNVNPFTVNAGMDKTLFCGGTAQFDSITTNFTGDGTLSYHWSPSTGLNYDSIPNPKSSVITNTKYYVTVTTPNGCMATDSVSVSVYPLSADAGSDKTIICGGIAQLDNVTSNYTESGTLMYNWSPSAGLNYDTIPNPTATVTNNTTYFVTVTTPNGCAAFDSVTVFVNPLTANAGSDKNLICGGTAQLDNVTSNYTGTGILYYDWSPAIGLNYDTIPNPTATVTNNSTYFVTVTTPNGCSSFDSVKVFVNPLTISGPDVSTICGESSALNTTTNYTGTGLLTYSWFPVNGLDNPTSANPVVTIDSTQTYTVTVTTPNGCVASNNVNVSLTPMTAPEICIVSVDSSNKNIIVWNKPVSTAIDSFYVYRETNITGIFNKIASISYDSLSVFVDTTSFPDVQSNKYQISVKDDCGLESAKSAAHKTMHLTINQGMGTTWNLIWEAYEGFTVSTYNVYRGADANSLIQIGTSPGTNTTYSDLNAPAGYLYYQVELMIPNFCNPTKSFNSSRSNVATNNPNGISENSILSDLFSIYPNPANDKIEISVSQKSEIEILNAEGQILKSFNAIANRTTVDLSGFAAGVYFVKVQTSKGVAVKKFVKE